MRRPFPTNGLDTRSSVCRGYRWKTTCPLILGLHASPPYRKYDWRSLPSQNIQRGLTTAQPEKPRTNKFSQAFPLTGFYKLLLENPQTPSEHRAYYPLATSPQDVRPTSVPSRQLEPKVPPLSAQLVFGSPLAGPRQNEDRLKERGKIIGGIRVPPKPQEPDNCCMSGCVNCVWDIFREDLENWAAAQMKAEKALQLQSRGISSNLVENNDGQRGSGVNYSPDTSDTLHNGVNMWAGLEDIPIGIRVFMDTEKAIKSKRGA